MVKSMKKTQKSDEKSDSEPANRKIDTTVLTAIIGGIVTVAVALISILPQFLKPSQPVEAPPTLAATAIVNPTSTFLPTAILPETVSAATVSTSTPIATPSPTPGIPSISCLTGWQLVSTDSTLQPTPESQGSCDFASSSTLGITSSQGQLLFGLSQFRNIGIFGVSAPIPANANFHFQVNEIVLFQASFWVAISNDPTPGSNMTLMSFEPQNGELRLYVNDLNSLPTRYIWDDLSNGLGGPPYVYNLNFSIKGNSVGMSINDVVLPNQVVNSPRYLFIGYRNKSSLGAASIQVNISNLTGK